LAEDADAIAMLSGQLGYSISAEETAKSITAISNSNNDVVYIAVDGSKVIGWIHLFYTLRLESAAYCEIGGLVVDEAYRGKGVGRMLIEHAKPWCKTKNCNKLRVRSNTKRNAAHAFYERADFKEIKLQKVFEIKLV